MFKVFEKLEDFGKELAESRIRIKELEEELKKNKSEKESCVDPIADFAIQFYEEFPEFADRIFCFIHDKYKIIETSEETMEFIIKDELKLFEKELEKLLLKLYGGDNK